MLKRSLGIGRRRSVPATMLSQSWPDVVAPGTRHAMPIRTGESILSCCWVLILLLFSHDWLRSNLGGGCLLIALKRLQAKHERRLPELIAFNIGSV